MSTSQPGPFRFWGKVDPTHRAKPAIYQATLAAPTSEGAVATMRLYDPIDSYGDFWGVSASEFSEALAQVPVGTTEIRLHVNSPGGEIYEGIAILNQLRNHPARVVAVVEGLAASIASVIVTGSDEVVMSPNSELMIHEGWGICIGNSADMNRVATDLDRLSDNIASVYAEKATGEVTTWRAAMVAETWYSAQQAVDAGLADSVSGTETAAVPDGEIVPRNRFDLSIFKAQGGEQEIEIVDPSTNPLDPSIDLPDLPDVVEVPSESFPTRDEIRHRMNRLIAA